MSDRRKRAWFFVPLFVGFFGLASLLNFGGSPAFATIRTVDVVRLIGVGMCFGVALATLILYFRGPRSG